MIPGVSQPEIQRQVRQQRVDQKFDALDIKLDRRSVRSVASSPRFCVSSAVDSGPSGFHVSLRDPLAGCGGAAPPVPESASELCAPDGIRTPNLLIRRHGRRA